MVVGIDRTHNIIMLQLGNRHKGLIGYGRPIDMNLMHNKHHIRMIGGQKLYSRDAIFYKTVISDALSCKPVSDKRLVKFPNTTWYKGEAYER